MDNFVDDETGELYPDWIDRTGRDTILFCLIGGFVGRATGALVLCCLIGGLVGPAGIACSCRGLGFALEPDAFFRSFANRFLNLVLCAFDSFVSSLSFGWAVGFTDCGLDNLAIVISFLNLLRCALDSFAFGCVSGADVVLLCFVGLFDLSFCRVGADERGAISFCFVDGGGVVFGRTDFAVGFAFSRRGCCGFLFESFGPFRELFTFFCCTGIAGDGNGFEYLTLIAGGLIA